VPLTVAKQSLQRSTFEPIRAALQPDELAAAMSAGTALDWADAIELAREIANKKTLG